MNEALQLQVDQLKNALALDPARLEEMLAAASQLASEFPDDAWLRAELGGVFDYNGFESEACIWYERALAFGVESFPTDQAADFFVWYGSTLRNIGRITEAQQQLESALARWPRSSALQFFWALALMSLGRLQESIVALAELHSGAWDDSLQKYQRAVNFYLETELRPLNRPTPAGPKAVD